MNKLTDNEIVKSLESLLDIMRAYESQQASIGKGLVEDIISMYNRQKAEKEAMLSHIKCLQYENDKLRTRNREAQLEINRQKAEIERLNRALVTQEKQHELKMRLSKRK